MTQSINKEGKIRQNVWSDYLWRRVEKPMKIIKKKRRLTIFKQLQNNGKIAAQKLTN